MVRCVPSAWHADLLNAGTTSRLQAEAIGTRRTTSVRCFTYSRRILDRNPSSDLHAALFPEQYKARRDAELQKVRQRELRAKYEEDIRTSKHKAEAETKHDSGESAIPSKCVLLLSAASKNLILKDFLNISFRGQHLAAWSGHFGQPLKVIPGRNLSTLERLEYYCLVFGSQSSAEAFRERALKLSKFFDWHGPATRIPETRPPRGLDFPGEDATELLQKYALTAQGGSLDLMLLKPPFPPAISDMVEKGGYACVVDRPEKSPAEVILRTGLVKVSVKSLKSVVEKAEKERNLPWTLSTFGKVKIRPWEAADVSNLLREAARHYHGIGKYVLDDALLEQTSSAAMAELEEMPLDVDMDEEGMTDAPIEDPALLSATGTTFILGVQTAAQAEALARYWHRRRLRVKRKKGSSVKPPDLELTAEVLW